MYFSKNEDCNFLDPFAEDDGSRSGELRISSAGHFDDPCGVELGVGSSFACSISYSSSDPCEDSDLDKLPPLQTWALSVQCRRLALRFCFHIAESTVAVRFQKYQ